VPVLPQIQWLEATMIANKMFMSGLYGYDEDGFRDGIRVNPQNKVVAYKVLQDSNPDVWDLAKNVIIPADSMRHLFDSERATSIRGLPWGYHGMNSALDILDLTALEKHAEKIHAAQLVRSDVVQVTLAVVDLAVTSCRSRTARRRMARRRSSPTRTLRVVPASCSLTLTRSFNSSLPTARARCSRFIDFLVRDMAWGFGVPPEFIWSVAGLGGPNSRVVLADANWFFEEVQDLMVDLLCRPIYTWVISRAVLRGELPECKDPRWWTCHWQGPAKVTIDEGKEGALELERLNQGCGTWEEFWARRGKVGRKQVFKRIDELKETMDYAKKQGVPFEYVVQMKPGTPGQSLDKALNDKSQNTPQDHNPVDSTE
jgi:capsid protein